MTAAYAYVPVRPEQLDAVYAFLADLSGADTPTDPPTPSAQPDEEVDHSPTAGWTEELTVRMLRESNRRPHDAMAIIARAGDDGIATDELAERLGYDHGAASVAGMLGALTKRCKSRYGVDEPYTRRWPDHDHGEHDTLLFVDEPVRSWVISNTDDPDA